MKTSVCVINLLLVLLQEAVYSQYSVGPSPCSSEVYCYGPLLEMVQMSRIFNDSKTFVDMKMKSPPDIILLKFFNFMAIHKNRPKRVEVLRFVEDNFEPPGQEFLEWELEDWTPNPKFLEKVEDNNLKQWGHYLNALWKDLVKKIKDDVFVHQDLYSIIWVPNPILVPGGRYREFYYWDTYWIVQGLFLSEMFTTARGMIENLLYVIETYGYIPNGGRIYYLDRSQPPLLTPMIKLYLDATQDVTFIKKHIHTLEREFDFWMLHRVRKFEVHGKFYTLAAYGMGSEGPRPDSYYEDVNRAKFFDAKHEKEAFYSEIKAAGESGWDFSSRWFISNGTNRGDLTTTKTRSIIPVDLNAIIFWNAKLLGEFHELLGHKDKAAYYTQKSHDWLKAVTAVLWHEDIGAWLDYDLQNSIRREYFYPSNMAPLWTGCYPKHGKVRMVRGVLEYLKKQNISSYFGDIPASFSFTEHQWDYPNILPQLQHVLVVGLSNTQIPEAVELARKSAEAWIKTYFEIFDKTRGMLEKYGAIFLSAGSVGEYEINLSSGWTIGMVIGLLDRYGNEVILNDEGFYNIVRSKYFLYALKITCGVLGIFACLMFCIPYCKNRICVDEATEI